MVSSRLSRPGTKEAKQAGSLVCQSRQKANPKSFSSGCHRWHRISGYVLLKEIQKKKAALRKGSCVLTEQAPRGRSTTAKSTWMRRVGAQVRISLLLEEDKNCFLLNSVNKQEKHLRFFCLWSQLQSSLVSCDPISCTTSHWLRKHAAY